MFSGGFKRSGLFGLIGVIVVAGIVAAIGLSSEGQSDPKATYALIFGVLAVFFVALFALQRADLDRAARGDAKAIQRAVAEGGGKARTRRRSRSSSSGRRSRSSRSTARRSRPAARCGA